MDYPGGVENFHLEFRYSVSGGSKRTYLIWKYIYGLLLGVIFPPKKHPDRRSSYYFVTANEAKFNPRLSDTQNRSGKFHIDFHIR